MNPQALQVLATVLGTLLTACVLVIGFGFRSYLNNNKEIRTTLSKVNTTLEVMNTSGSIGARALVERVNERLAEHDTEFDAVNERHNSLALSVGIMADRLNGHVQLPVSRAHPAG